MIGVLEYENELVILFYRQVIDTLHSGFRDNFRDLQDNEPLYKEDIDELRFLLSQSCKLELKDVLYAHNKDSCDLSGKFIINHDCILRFENNIHNDIYILYLQSIAQTLPSS